MLNPHPRRRAQREAGTLASENAPVAPAETVLPLVAGVPNIHKLMETFDALREREQQRLAREMHDDFGQLLAAMKLDLCMLHKKVANGDCTGLPQVENLQELVDTMITSTRRIIAELPPKAIDDLGLFPALEQLVAGFRKRHPIRLITSMGTQSTRLDSDVELATYRVLQEALNNIVRHAGATIVNIDVNCSTTHLRLRIRDNGNGICATELGKSGSFGLLWMQERIQALAGTIDIDSSAGQGTCIAISLPLQPAATGRNI